MQYQPTAPIAPLTLESNIGFTYNSSTRTFSCLGQIFTNVSLFEMEIYREIAICNYNHNNRPATPQKATIKTPLKIEVKQSVNKSVPKNPAYQKPASKQTKHQANKAKSTKPVHRKKSN